MSTSRFVIDFRQVGDFSQIKMTATMYLKCVASGVKPTVGHSVNIGFYWTM